MTLSRRPWARRDSPPLFSAAKWYYLNHYGQPAKLHLQNYPCQTARFCPRGRELGSHPLLLSAFIKSNAISGPYWALRTYPWKSWFQQISASVWVCFNAHFPIIYHLPCLFANVHCARGVTVTFGWMEPMSNGSDTRVENGRETGKTERLTPYRPVGRQLKCQVKYTVLWPSEDSAWERQDCP